MTGLLAEGSVTWWPIVLEWSAPTFSADAHRRFPARLRRGRAGCAAVLKEYVECWPAAQIELLILPELMSSEELPPTTVG